MKGRGLFGIRFLPQGQTLIVDYYINNILAKEVKPVLHRTVFRPYPYLIVLQMSLQSQHFLLSYFKTLSAGPVEEWTHDLPLSSTGNLPND